MNENKRHSRIGNVNACGPRTSDPIRLTRCRAGCEADEHGYTVQGSRPGAGDTHRAWNKRHMAMK